MTADRTRPACFVALGLVAMTGVAVPLGIDATEQRNQRIAAQMMTIAQNVQVPIGVTLRERHDCVGDGGVVACWSSQQEPAELAVAFQGALTLAAHWPSQMSCDTLTFDMKLDSCLVRLDRSGHAVLVSIDSDVSKDQTGARHKAGSVLRIDAG